MVHVCDEEFKPPRKYIGKGTFGIVYPYSDNYVLKYNKRPHKECVVAYNLAELDILHNYSKHENIITLIGIKTNVQHTCADRYHFILERADYDLYKYIEKHKKKLSVTTKKNIAYDILKGLSYLHKNGIIHRDLSMKNVLIFVDHAKVTAKISDFGTSCHADNIVAMSETKAITCNVFRAPEVYKNEKYSKSIDIWAYGIILYMMFIDMGLIDEFLDFEDDYNMFKTVLKKFHPNHNDLLVKMHQMYPTNLDDINTELRDVHALIDLIKRSLNTNKVKRIRVSGIMKHKFFEAHHHDATTFDKDSEGDTGEITLTHSMRTVIRNKLPSMLFEDDIMTYITNYGIHYYYKYIESLDFRQDDYCDVNMILCIMIANNYLSTHYRNIDMRTLLKVKIDDEYRINFEKYLIEKVLKFDFKIRMTTLYCRSTD